MKLLRTCFTLLFPERPAEALVSSATFESLGALTAPVQMERTIVALLPYRVEQVRALVREAKFHDNQKAHVLLASVLADYVREVQADLDSFEERTIVLVPIPLSKKRLKERGYNQVARIAHRAVSSLEHVILANTLLVRVRDTPPQTSLTGPARRLNLEGAFQVQGTLNPEHTYIVLDDVVTTGATLKTALSALTQAGLPRVSGLSLAH